ncbi:LuxR C-terminal-related transcriptional regulator [Streptomyces sp. NPDC005529]|uniref:helix-turn-helix transcriptional regulator n=1 Tax=unclassified Streptomyces TaxID=2593676 RepID=UPI0033B36B84
MATAHGNTDEALACYRAGLAVPAHAGNDIPVHRAFLHHDLARILLATSDQDTRSMAITHLRQARDEYAGLGASPHVQRIDSELAGLLPHGSVRVPSTQTVATDSLTEREHMVASLAAHGMTNQKIGRELYISPKTVEYHLGHVYEKLDITSRRQLSGRVDHR